MREIPLDRIMKELLVVASAVLVLTLLLSIPVEALQGKHLDAAISNVRSSWDAPLILKPRCSANFLHFFSCCICVQLSPFAAPQRKISKKPQEISHVRQESRPPHRYP